VVRDWRELVIGMAMLSSTVVFAWLAYVLRDDFRVAPFVIAGIAALNAIRGLVSIWSSTSVAVRAADARDANGRRRGGPRR
jgi:hypothetical protein